ncbi:MAG: hypothetical protein AUJ98_04905 [Bacteroidetes bacterium CG2_30_33_31]|nr:MAG: hypothetical protein AUJ98_04905 [Bacteroidetes bacterium CG2_30_33_31]
MKSNYFNKSIKLFIGLIFTFCVSSCNETKHITFIEKEKNPTEFVFHENMQKVRQIIIANFSKWQYCDYGLFQNKNYKNGLLSLPENKNDFTFESLHSGCASKVYFQKNGKPFIYDVDKFHIHLDSLDSNTTKVRIIVINPKIATRLTLLPTLFGSRAQKYKAVPPTTVEEYEILLIIGRALNVKYMPELVIPKKVILSKW